MMVSRLEKRRKASDSLSIVRPALAVQLSDVLRDLILEGELKSGQKIREKELTERYGVSRTPLREAMKILASEGLLDLKVTASQEENRNRFSIRVSWQTDDSSEKKKKSLSVK